MLWLRLTNREQEWEKGLEKEEGIGRAREDQGGRVGRVRTRQEEGRRGMEEGGRGRNREEENNHKELLQIN